MRNNVQNGPSTQGSGPASSTPVHQAQTRRVGTQRVETRRAEPISPERKRRLVILVGVLAAALALGLALKINQSTALARQRRAAADTVDAARKALRDLDLTLAKTSWEKAKELSAVNPEVDRLGVALFYAGGRLDLSLSLFNSLDPQEMAKGVDEGFLAQARQAAASLGVGQEEVNRTGVGQSDAQYLQGCGLVWNLVRQTLPSDAGSREKALLICRWFALHTLPGGSEELPSWPASVIWGGRGTPGQLAWAYAEVARQAGLRCHVAVVPPASPGGKAGYLVQVYPADGGPFLVDAAAGVPVVDPASGVLLSLESVTQSPGVLLDVTGPAAQTTPDFKAAQLKAAVHPYGLLPRFIAFEHLLGELPVHPRVALSPEELAEASKAGFWELPVQSVLRQPTPEQAEQIARTYAPLALIDAPRQVHLMGACELADAAYQAVGKDLKQKLTQADVEETISVLAEAMENLAFFRALNACDGGNMSEGEKLLREYLKAYPTGRWAALARTDLSEVLDQKGEAAAAENLWKDLPAERKLFGSLRLRGMLGSARPPAPPAPSPAAAGEAEPGALAR